MKNILYLFIFLTLLSGCNYSDQGTDAAKEPGLIENDTAGDARGARGPGADNSGGTPGPGTITDTLGGKTDTQDHRSGAARDSIK